MKEVTMYTDGACSYNPGPGGWACVLIYKNVQKEFSGYESLTTNNKMELTAVIKGLELLKEDCLVNVYTDSAYVSNAFLEGWVDNWQANNFRSANKKDIQNKELWQTLIKLCNQHKVIFHKVKGHADNELNNLCDKLATSQIAQNANK